MIFIIILLGNISKNRQNITEKYLSGGFNEIIEQPFAYISLKQRKQ